jgi:exodeoxyribonuclease VII small subunit
MDAEIGFEANLKKLEKAVRALESGELGLDAALANYEDGVRMLADCHQMLDAAGKKVALLTGATDESGEPETAPFDATATIESPTRPGKAAKARPKSEGIEDLPY